MPVTVRTQNFSHNLQRKTASFDNKSVMKVYLINNLDG